jgi:hypothetical protein
MSEEVPWQIQWKKSDGQAKKKQRKRDEREREREFTFMQSAKAGF